MKDQGLHILIVDDDDKDVDMISGYLENYIRRIILSHVRTAEEAVQKLNNHKYDLCLIDIHLPVMGGLDFIQHVLNNGDNLPTIIITGRGDEKTAVKAMKLGSHDYLIKSEIDELF